MNSAGLIALDNGCRGAAAGLLLMFAAVRLRDPSATSVTRIGAALAGAGAASAIIEAPGFPSEWYWGSLPLIALSSNGPVAFWLWARAQLRQLTGNSRSIDSTDVGYRVCE